MDTYDEETWDEERVSLGYFSDDGDFHSRYPAQSAAYADWWAKQSQQLAVPEPEEKLNVEKLAQVWKDSHTKRQWSKEAA